DGPVAAPAGQPAERIDTSSAPRPATDDWPFLYLREANVAPHYLAALAIVLVGAVLAVGGAARAARTPIASLSPHFFALGAAFLLLETRSLATFGLLFGTTWAVNALVFAAILVSVLLAIAVDARVRGLDARILYLGLFGSLAVAYLLPPAALLFEPAALRYATAAAIAFAPVFFANLVFSHSFRDSRAADIAFASNLLGAMVGGVAEYAALVTGHQALLLIVAALYGGAYLLGLRERRAAATSVVRESDAALMPRDGAPA
ncbi:MAG: hypothetical protein ACRDF0_06695, partial [Candidatus Limnocylindria bacterium]